MGLLESFRVSLDALMANKMRSFLTMLGIVIGVCCIILIISFGQGLQKVFMEEVQALGSDLLVVIPGKKEVTEAGGPGGRNIRFKGPTINRMRAEDAVLIRKACPAVKAACPSVEAGAKLSYLGQELDGRIEGTTAEYREVRAPKLAEGTFFTEEQSRSAQRVAVIGSKVREELFGGENPLGKKIRVNVRAGEVPFYVIGVMAEHGMMFGGEDNEKVIIPVRCAQEMLDTNLVFSLYATATSHEDVDVAQKQITRVLSAKHGEEDFDFLTMKEISTMITQVLGAFTIFLGSIAAVSLVVGGIGIMNIMLASVTERTREIGIRKAVGARGKNILVQFLIEAALLSVLGGAIGIAIGYGASAAVTAKYPENFPTHVSLASVVLATGFAAGVGIFFGVWPARRAAKLDPIVALRYE
jgi:putative ABC transport system permease protein